MNRNIKDKIIDWKKSSTRKPLILNGARQVGKTWLLKEIGNSEFKSVAYCNLESSFVMQNAFQNGFDLQRILAAIQIETGVSAVENETLIIFDEIQAVPEALTSLKYFYEKAPQFYIACAGSLLGLSLGANHSFPVGKIEFIEIYPLDFLEFLLAIGQPKLVEIIENQQWDLVNTFHVKIKEYLRIYYYTGGMPEVVNTYIETRDLDKVRQIQNQILDAYQFDFAKHAPINIVPRIRMLWQSIPAQLAKENKKFIYNAIKSGARAKDYELALHWLIDAGLVHKINNVNTPKTPLKSHENYDAFKLYLLDTGLLGAMVQIEASSIIFQQNNLNDYKGVMTEQYVLQQLKAQNISAIYYWSQNESQAEIDFLVDYKSKIIPIEVKAELNLQAKSLKVFFQKFIPDIGVRISMSDYAVHDTLIDLPLCAAGGFYNLMTKNA